MKPRFQNRTRQQRGYVLLTLMLFVALLTLGLLTMVQNIETQIKRDREEEMIHRGVQYSRAVRLFYIKFKRFPSSVEELENTNNIRFLRKRYKDPITGKDFKPLHLNEVAIFQRPGTDVTAPPEAQPQDPPAGVKSPEAASDPTEAPAANSSAESTPALDPQDVADAAEAAANLKTQEPEAIGAPPPLGVPIVGVVSLSKEKTIREFNKKDHYNQWLFIFNPAYAVTLINTPDQPRPWSQAPPSVLPNKNQSQYPSATTGQPNSGPAPAATNPNSQ